MNALFMIAAAILLLGPLIAIHEFGHYWVARKLGVKVLVYSIGFGPTLLKWQSKKSGIQYQLSALPLGGYVKMLDEREGNVAEKDLPYAFNRQSPWKRIAIVAAGPVINLLFAVFLFWILFLPAQEQLNTRIGKILPNTPAAQVDLKVGDKIVMVDGKTTPTWEKLNYALVSRVGETGHVSIVVDRAGTEKQVNLNIQNFIKDQSQSPLDVLGFLPYRPVVPAVVKELSAEGAAIRQGMKAGDRIVAIDKTAMKDWFDVVEVVQKSPDDLSLPDVMADRDQLIQVMLNISVNAVQAMTENKDFFQDSTPELQLRTRIQRLVTINGVLHRSTVRIDIEDNGPGVPENILESVFYPLVTGRAKGTGLGLSIAQNIMHQHNGMIECQSVAGKTVFSLYLPWETDRVTK